MVWIHVSERDSTRYTQAAPCSSDSTVVIVDWKSRHLPEIESWLLTRQRCCSNKVLTAEKWVTASLATIKIDSIMMEFEKVGVRARRAVGTTGVYRWLCTVGDLLWRYWYRFNDNGKRLEGVYSIRVPLFTVPVADEDVMRKRIRCTAWASAITPCWRCREVQAYRAELHFRDNMKG